MRRIILGLALVLGIACFFSASNTFADVTIPSDICNDAAIDPDLQKAAGCETTETAPDIAIRIINVVLTMVGLLAVGVIVYGGIVYATSTGDANKIRKAHHTILYGVIGLVVSLMAFAIVTFVNASILQK